MPIDLKPLEQTSRQLVDAALKAGADACDVTVSNGQSLNVSWRDGKVENTGRSEGDSFSLRVFVGRRIAVVATNQAGDLDMIAERAVAMAKVSPEDPYQALPDADEVAREFPDLEMLDETRLDVDTLAEMARQAEDAGRRVKGVSKSMGSGAGWGVSGFVLAASNGFCGSFARSSFGVSAAMVCGEGEAMERDYDFSSTVFAEDLLSAQEIGRSAGERAVKRANPRQVESGNFPVIFDRRLAGGLLGALAGAINGASIARKTSFLRDTMETRITRPDIQIHDNPLRARGQGSRPFDGEGLACKPMTLVRDGVLQDWLLDGATARELGLQTNARASRSGSGTSPATTNMWMEPGEKTIEELAREIGTGFYCTETIGHGINMVTGDYSKGASGYWIDGGEITWPVAGITVAGNLKDMFLSMIPASDLEFRGSVNAPSLMIDGMTIGGK